MGCQTLHGVIRSPFFRPWLYSFNAPRVRFSFQCRNGWQVNFLESDLKTSLRKHLTFASEQKIVELAERGNADLNLESRAAIEHGIGNWPGRVLPEPDRGAVSTTAID